MKRTLFMVAGESSGDTLGAGLIRAIKAKEPDINIIGVGGPQMIEAGLTSLIDMERLNVMGFVEPIKRLPDLLKIRKYLISQCIEQQSDMFIGIDFQEFNFSLAKALKKKHITTMQYVSPTIWAWRPKRIKKLIKAVDHLLLIYPFEKALYKDTPIQAHYVGHTLADNIPEQINTDMSKQALNISAQSPVLTVMPGSRSGEIRSLSVPFIQTAKILSAQIPSLKILVPMVNESRAELFADVIKDEDVSMLDMQVHINKAHDCIAASDAVLLASGTATLETMLLKKPMVVGYKLGAITYQLAKRLVKTDHIAMPNILAGQTLVNEFIQHECEPQKMAEDCAKWFKDSEQLKILKDNFNRAHLALKQNANEKAAKVVLTAL